MTALLPPDDTPSRPPIPGFVLAMGDAADAAIRQGVPYAEAVRRAEFALYTEYEAAGEPTCWLLTGLEETDAR